MSIFYFLDYFLMCQFKFDKNRSAPTWSRTACSCFRFMSLMYQATAVIVMMASSTTSYPESLLSKCLDSSWQKGETLITVLKLKHAAAWASTHYSGFGFFWLLCCFDTLSDSICENFLHYFEPAIKYSLHNQSKSYRLSAKLYKEHSFI